MPLSRHSAGTYLETSSHATRQGTFGQICLSSLSHLWTDPGLKSGISARELISTTKKKKKKNRLRRGMNGRTFFQNPRA